LRAAGVRFDIVPGVTSAVAAAGLAGIPVTHRGLSSAFLVASGHDLQAFATAVGQLTPNGVTLVIMMGVGRRAALASHLIDRGWAVQTPAAIVAAASTERQQVWRGVLSDLVRTRVVLAATVAEDDPAVIIVGDVAALDVNDKAGEETAAGEPAATEVTVRRRDAFNS
jgi:siroheme synthase